MDNITQFLIGAMIVAALCCLLWIIHCVGRMIRKATPKRFTWYTHHGNKVCVQKRLKGKHRDHCLCFSCEKFHPGAKDNCDIAKALYRLCVDNGLVTPVWECGRFIEA